jgi:hypothetical protein
MFLSLPYCFYSLQEIKVEDVMVASNGVIFTSKWSTGSKIEWSFTHKKVKVYL